MSKLRTFQTSLIDIFVAKRKKLHHRCLSGGAKKMSETLSKVIKNKKYIWSLWGLIQDPNVYDEAF